MTLRLVLVSLFLLGCDNSESRQTERTTNEQKEWIQKHLAGHVIHMGKTHDGNVRIRSDGSIRNDKGLSEFEIVIGGRFQSPPDHHSWIRYELKEIQEDGVIMKYESGFDHRSFGKNLVTIDTGEVFREFIE